jgi:hypothetical protein
MPVSDFAALNPGYQTRDWRNVELTFVSVPRKPPFAYLAAHAGLGSSFAEAVCSNGF